MGNTGSTSPHERMVQDEVVAIAFDIDLDGDTESDSEPSWIPWAELTRVKPTRRPHDVTAEPLSVSPPETAACPDELPRFEVEFHHIEPESHTLNRIDLCLNDGYMPFFDLQKAGKKLLPFS
jgi:hypothetical protein